MVKCSTTADAAQKWANILCLVLTNKGQPDFRCKKTPTDGAHIFFRPAAATKFDANDEADGYITKIMMMLRSH